MVVLDREHFFKVNGDFLLLVDYLSIAVDKGNFNELLINSGKLAEAFKNLKIEEIK